MRSEPSTRLFAEFLKKLDKLETKISDRNGFGTGRIKEIIF